MSRLGRACGLWMMGLLVACEAAGGAQEDVGDAREGSLSPGQMAQVTLRCQFYYRESNELGPGDALDDPKFVHAEKVLSARAGESAEATHAKITLRVAQSGGQKFEGGAFNISATADEKMIASWLYQFDPADPPRDQFSGGHGFTGLVYLTHPNEGGDYQFTCSAVRE